MWDFKLFFFNIFFITYLNISYFFNFLFDLFYPELLNGFFLINWLSQISFPFNYSIFFGFKFCLCITFLILIRGGTPRYRYDYLTKLGWLKFLSLTFLVFSFSILFFFFFNQIYLKLEHLFFFLNFYTKNFVTWLLIFLNFFFNFFYFSCIFWNISNYADSYWYIYNNKKLTFEKKFF